MTENPFKVVQVQKGMPHHTQASSSEGRDIEARANFERQWLIDPQQFDPSRNVMERERIDRSWKHVKPLLNEPEVKVADLGFGWGTLAEKVHNRGAQVDAVEIAENAIKRFSPEYPNIRCIRDTLPRSSLPDDTYDLIICTDLIAELDPKDHRMLVSELYRLLKPEGRLICSTPLDYRTDGALESFATLIDTEFEVIEWEVSHHAYLLSLLNLFGKARFLAPIHRFLSNNRPFALFLESICRAISPDTGVTHAICIAKCKSLNTTQPVDMDRMEPQNQRLRRRVWE